MVCAIASLTYTFMRLANLLASAHLQFAPAVNLLTGEATVPDSTPGVLVELQALNSRPMLERAVARIASDGVSLASVWMCR